MALDDLFKSKFLKHGPYVSFIFGFGLTIVAFFTSLVFFRDYISVSTIFLTTLLLTPTFILMLKSEVKIDRQYGLRNFFKNHKTIFEVYFFSFIGIFLAFVFLGLAVQDRPGAYNSLFEFQLNFLEFQQGVNVEVVQNFVESTLTPSLGEVIALSSHDLIVVLICFGLSFVYGASAIFLIILNGSVFANFIIFVIRIIAENTTQGIQAFLIFLIHLIPEISGFLLAAIAGGVASKALVLEMNESNALRNVFKDVTVLLLISIGLVIVSTILEVFVTARLFQAVF